MIDQDQINKNIAASGLKKAGIDVEQAERDCAKQNAKVQTTKHGQARAAKAKAKVGKARGKLAEAEEKALDVNTAPAPAPPRRLIRL